MINNLILIGVSVCIIIPLWILIDKKTKEKEERIKFTLGFVRWLNINFDQVGSGCKFYTDGQNKYDLNELMKKYTICKGKPL
jgi:hypothetical protein